jgi:hypothetical protein
MPLWLKLSFSRSVVRRAACTAVFVGVILASINYGDVILHGTITQTQAFRMVLTFFVPYCVSTYSSVSAILNMKSSRSE